MRNRFLPFTMAVAMAAASTALAQHRGDVLLDLPQSQPGQPMGPIRTNQFNLDGTVINGVRVFSVILGGTGTPNFTDTPGYDSLPATFPYPSSNGFRIRKALRRWNGQSFERITAVPAETIEITFGPIGPVYSPPCDTITEGFTLQVGSNGEWHKHLEYTITEPARTGIYLLEMQLYSNSPAITPCRPYWLVFQQANAADNPPPDPAALLAAQDAAIQWVDVHLVPRLCDLDQNADGVLTVGDIFAFLASWFSGNGDFNGDCASTVSDIFAFIGAWFGGCH